MTFLLLHYAVLSLVYPVIDKAYKGTLSIKTSIDHTELFASNSMVVSEVLA